MRRKPKSMTVRVFSLGMSLLLMAPPLGWAQVVQPASATSGQPPELLELSWIDAPLDVVLNHYAELTGRTLIKSPGVPAVLITLKSQTMLTENEFMVAIESTLRMHAIALVPMGDKFLKVIPAAELGTHGEQIEMGKPEGDEMRNADVIERRIVELKHLELAEIQPVIDQLKHASAKIQPLERANSFLITDTKLNLDRIIEIIEFLDKPVSIKVETRVYELQHAEAGEVASRLSELIEQSRSSGQARTPSARPTAASSRGGIIRAGTTAARTAAAQPQTTASGQSAMDLAQRGIIQGEVKIVSDERTNILIIISEPPNYAFFDQIVTVLDKAIDPEIAVEVLPLEYADAEEISGILNDFVGAATQESSRSGTRRESATPRTSTGADARSTALQEFIARRQATSPTTGTTPQGTVPGIGQLSEATRILADARTNSILLMGRRSDIDALRRVVDDLDVMLSQVMIEAVILEVTLTDDIETGFDWLQRSYQAYSEDTLGPGGGYTVREPVVGFGGAQPFTGNTFIDGGSVDRDTAFQTGALTYFATFYDLNVDVILQLAASSTDARILSTPVVVTTDNTEARIIVGESRPGVTSTSVTAGGVGRNTFQYQDIGIELTVTPRINPQKFVVMEIVQTADNVGGFEVIDGNNVPIITKREMEAQIAVENRSSIVLGGLIANEQRKTRTKIPILGDIPILGALFRSDFKEENRGELLVVITPYVMSTPEEALEESQRLGRRSVVTGGNAWAKTWSDSPMIRDKAPVEEKAPQPLFDRLKGPGDETEAIPPESLLVPMVEEDLPEVTMRPAPIVEYRVIPDPGPPPETDAEAMEAPEEREDEESEAGSMAASDVSPEAVAEDAVEEDSGVDLPDAEPAPAVRVIAPAPVAVEASPEAAPEPEMEGIPAAEALRSPLDRLHLRSLPDPEPRPEPEGVPEPMDEGVPVRDAVVPNLETLPAEDAEIRPEDPDTVVITPISEDVVEDAPEPTPPLE